MKPQDDSDKIPVDEQKLFSSELGGFYATFLEMHHLIKDALDTRNLGHQVEQNGKKQEPWDIF